MISNVELKGLEYQISYFTKLNVKTLGKCDSSLQIALIEKFEDRSMIDFIIEFFFNNSNKTVDLLHTWEISGFITLKLMHDIDDAINIFNKVNER